MSFSYTGMTVRQSACAAVVTLDVYTIGIQTSNVKSTRLCE